MNIGDRIGAILNNRRDEVDLFGYGIYEGEFYSSFTDTNESRFKLDSGLHVWDYECFYAPEQKIKNLIYNKKVNLVEEGKYKDP